LLVGTAGDSALCLAAGDGSIDATRVLLERAAKDRGPALARAARNGHKAVCQLLLDHTAPVNFADASIESPLCGAARMGHVDVCRLLLLRGADANTAGTGAAKSALLPLVVAAQQGQAVICRLLLEHGALVDAQQETTGMTSLLAAAQVCLFLAALHAYLLTIGGGRRDTKRPRTRCCMSAHPSICPTRTARRRSTPPPVRDTSTCAGC
jgi:ankyrin repeat protein